LYTLTFLCDMISDSRFYDITIFLTICYPNAGSDSLATTPLPAPQFQMQLPDRPMWTPLNGAGLQDFFFILFLIIQENQHTFGIVENGSGALQWLQL
jgi:hypothetical protein